MVRCKHEMGCEETVMMTGSGKISVGIGVATYTAVPCRGSLATVS